MAVELCSFEWVQANVGKWVWPFIGQHAQLSIQLLQNELLAASVDWFNCSSKTLILLMWLFLNLQTPRLLPLVQCVSSYQTVVIGIGYSQVGNRQVESGFCSGISHRIASQSIIIMTRTPIKTRLKPRSFNSCNVMYTHVHKKYLINQWMRHVLIFKTLQTWKRIR